MKGQTVLASSVKHHLTAIKLISARCDGSFSSIKALKSAFEVNKNRRFWRFLEKVYCQASEVATLLLLVKC